MTTPDTPDFVPSQVTVANSTVVQPLTAPAVTPISTTLYDCAAFATLYLAVGVLGDSLILPVQVTIQWYIQGQLVNQDVLSVWNGGPNAVTEAGTSFLLPVKGDQFTFNASSDANNPQVVFQIIGSTRQIGQLEVFSSVLEAPLAPAYVAGGNIPASATAKFYVGPFAKGIHLSASIGTGGTAQINVFTPVLQGPNWVNVAVGIVVLSGTAPIITEFSVAGRVFEVDFVNTTAAAHAYNLGVFELA